ncbi:hypothetical protein [Gilliamella sp. Gris1-4]|uniref:hypothetical protein n=1 Tax=Gilliamella sp. Gris1-4 TaxID=3120244 RepID=UPI00080E89B8|nr:hypothetical protein [Gilliamella apicola]OCG38601.1 hypothetical protein A9G31_01600 [Gilliamella apicola]
MTKLNWRKYPDEKPVTIRDDKIIALVKSKYCDKPFLQVFAYVREIELFYCGYSIVTDIDDHEDDTDDGKTVIAWTYLDELPLPQEYLCQKK